MNLFYQWIILLIILLIVYYFDRKIRVSRVLLLLCILSVMEIYNIYCREKNIDSFIEEYKLQFITQLIFVFVPMKEEKQKDQ